MLRGARVQARQAPIPTPEEIFAAADERLGESFLRDLANSASDTDPRARDLADRLLAERSPAEVVAMATGARSGTQPRYPQTDPGRCQPDPRRTKTSQRPT